MSENDNSLEQQAIVVNCDLEQLSGALQSRNVRIHDRRTSVRLEPEMWDALNDISRAENCSIHDLCGAVHDLKGPQASFTASLRVFLMEYYRAATRPDSRAAKVQTRAREHARLNGSGGRVLEGA